MTNMNTSSYWAAEVSRLQSEMETAQQDIALLLRLKAAEASAERLAAELKKAQASLNNALESDEVAATEVRLGRFRDIRIDEGMSGENLVRRTFRVFLTEEASDPWTGESVVSQKDVGTLSAIASDAYEYLVTRKPEAIPASIMALAPGEPVKALRRYFSACRLGYLKDDGDWGE